jgi:hypothetical protein
MKIYFPIEISNGAPEVVFAGSKPDALVVVRVKRLNFNTPTLLTTAFHLIVSLIKYI